MMKMVRKVLGLALCLGVLAGVLCLSASAEEGHRHPICGATHKDIGDHTGTCGNVAWTPWDGTSEITYNADNIAYVYLTGNVTRNEVAYSLDIEKDHTLYLCLNGNTITAEHGGSVIDIEGTNSTLVLSDCIGSGALTHGKEQSGGVRVGKDCVFIMYGGTISGNKVGTTGPGGGGVYVNNGRFEMYDGTIRNNEAGYNGGGVYVNGRFIMHDGMITDNTAAATSTNNSHPGGGGVYVSGTFEMKGGTISGNTATANGGGVYVRYSGTFEVSGDISISGNTASVGNGVFLVNSASLDSYITIADRLGDTVSIEVTTRMAPTSDRTAPVKIATATKDKSAFADLSKFTYTNKTADGEDILPFKIPKIGGVDIVACVHNYNGAPWQADENDHWHNCLICGSKDTPASHNYNKKDTGADYLASAATCTAPATYYYSCECGAVGTETFEDGVTNPDMHSGTLSEWQSDEDNHWKEYLCCHTESNRGKHSWNNGTVTKEATCTTAGEKTFTCNVCGKIKTEKINATGHDWATEWSHDGTSHWYECENGCGEKGQKAEHTFSEWSDGKRSCTECSYEETCTHSGGTATCTAKAVCKTCGEAYGGLDPTNHSGEKVWDTDANNHTQKWNCCNTVVVASEPHEWGTPTITPATCTTAGNKHYICDVCSAEKDETIPATGHTKGAAVKEKETAVTCTVDGSYDEVVYCTVCNAELSRTPRTIDALGHTWVDATCTEPKTCSVCSATEGSAMGHDWGDWTVITAATEDAEGTERRVCRNDGSHRQTRAIPKLAPADCSMGDDCPLCGFRDLKTDDWYHDGVHYCLEKGLMKGFADGLFQPGGDTTRAQLAMILWRLEGSPAVETAPEFDDVDPDAWYIGAVRWASAEGVVLGFGDGRFAPDEAVTREQMAAILWRYAARLSRDVSADGDLSGFADAASVSAYAVPALEWARATGLVEGIEQGGALRLAPGDPTTRAQMATLLLRFLTAA